MHPGPVTIEIISLLPTRQRISGARDARGPAPGAIPEARLSLSSETIYLQGGCDLRGVRALQALMWRIRPRTAWDIGANRGNHAAFMRPLCGRLVCFEPNPAEFRRLEALFKEDPGVILLDIGLSDRSAERPFLISAEESGNSTFEIEADQANALRSVKTGDEIVITHGVNDLDLIKIDVEGHEAAVLRGMIATILDQRPVIVFEVLEAQSTSDFGFSELLPGYSLYGNKTGLISGVTMGAYTFCRFDYHKTYMSALAVPNEKKALLSDILPE